jgi:TolB protein
MLPTEFSVGQPTNLTPNSEEDDQNPLWSPDSKTIIFNSKRSHGNFDIWKMNVDGSSPSALTSLSNHDAVHLPGSSWCATSDQIVFSSDSSGDENLWVMNSDGTGQKQVVDTPYLDREPTWSPNCDRITFQSERDGNWDIYTVKADGTGLVRLTTDSAHDWAPNWSPTSESILFQSKRTKRWTLWTIDADGSNLKQVSDSKYESTDASWRPDGKYIVYSTDQSANGGGARIAIHEILGAGAQPLLITESGGDYDGAPCWSADSKQVAFESDRSGNLDIWLVDLY